MNDDTLVCMKCDSVVSLRVGYEGYRGACDCQTYAVRPGSGEKPALWERAEDATRFVNIAVYTEGMIRRGTVIDEPSLFCAVCGDSPSMTVELESVSVGRYDCKATVRCENDHYYNDRPVEETAYLVSDSPKAKALRAVMSDE